MNNLCTELAWLPPPFAMTTSMDARHFLHLAYEHGNATSPDPSTKNGAVLVGADGKIITYSTNRFPKGVAETRTRLNDRPTKYRMVVHAESGAVLNAARYGKTTNGATLYCPSYACSECAKTIIQSGIRRVVGHAQIMIMWSKHPTWVESIQQGWGMMQEAGVECVLFDGTMGLLARLNHQDVVV